MGWTAQLRPLSQIITDLSCCFLGGRMVFVQLAVDKKGQFLGTTKEVPVSMHHAMRDLWQGMVDDGLITQVSSCVEKMDIVDTLPSLKPNSAALGD